MDDHPDSPLSPGQPSPAPDKQVRHITGWRRLLVWPLAAVVKLWLRSLRFDITEQDISAYRDTPAPTAFVLWHNRLFVISEVSRRFRPHSPVYGLVSASRDGAWLEAFFSMVGIRAVRGSSSRLGREAANALIDTLRAGKDVGVTPDGPRGPCYDFKGGVLIVTRRSHANLVLVGMEFQSCWRLRSWDRFTLPKPFSTVKITGKLLDPTTLQGERDEVVARLREQLLKANPDRVS